MHRRLTALGVDRLPDDASWEDLMYQIYLREAVDAGLRDANAWHLVSHDDRSAVASSGAVTPVV